MAVIIKGPAAYNLSTTGAWVGGVRPTSSDIAQWISTSLNHHNTYTSGSGLNILGFQIDGGTTDQRISSPVTFYQADIFTQGTSNNRLWQTTGIWTCGSAERNIRLSRSPSAGAALWINRADGLSSSGTVNVYNNSGTSQPELAILAVTGAQTTFTSTLRLKDHVCLLLLTGGATLTGVNIFIDGDGCFIYGSSGTTLGASAKTLTLANTATSLLLGAAGLVFTIANAVSLGSAPVTLTVNGDTRVTGTVTGSNGVTVAGASRYTFLAPIGNSSGLTGPATITGGRALFLGFPLASRYIPSSLTVSNNTEFMFYGCQSDFDFPVTPSGSGTVTIHGTFAGSGVTFPAFPSVGNILDFAGSVTARCQTVNPGNTAKVVISELPAGLRLVALPQSASPALTASITYTGAGQTKATWIEIDNEGSQNNTVLTAGTYLLSSSGSGPIVLSGTVNRTYSNGDAGGVAPTSARMNLTLGGSNTGDNTLSGTISEVGTNSAILGITKIDAGRWVLSGSNTYTGQIDVSGGTLSAQSANALGGTTGTVIIRSGATLELNGGYTFNKSGADWEARSASGGIDSIGANTIQCRNFALTESTTTFTVSTGNKLTIDPQLSGAVEGAITGVNLGIAKAGDGELELAANANTFSGAVTISAGTLTVGSVADGGAAAAWGQGTQVDVTGTLQYNGATGSSSRAVQMTGAAPTIIASGSGALTLSNITQDTTTKTMTLRGASTAANTVSSALANNTGAVSLAKEDAGKWVLSGALSYTGTTAVIGGTLRVQTSDSNTTSGAVTINPTTTVELVTDTLASTGASSGRVLGTGNVTCNGGTIKTRSGSTQNGQVRYGGDLTFGAGATLNIGAAA